MNDRIIEFEPLIEGVLIKRYKRFLADIKINDGDIKEKLKVTTGEELNMMDIGSYSRAQQAIDYVDRVKSYYQLISAHACVNPKDQLTFF